MRRYALIIATILFVGNAYSYNFMNKFLIHGSVGIGIPIGDMPDMFPEDRGLALGGENAFNLSGYISFGLTKNILTMLGVSNASYKITKAGNQTVDPHQQKVHDKVFALKSVVRYFFSLPNRPLVPYLQGGGGLYIVSTEVKNVGQGTKQKATHNSIGISTGAGFYIQPRKNIGIDLNLGFDFIFTTTDYNDINTKIFTISLGPVFVF